MTYAPRNLLPEDKLQAFIQVVVFLTSDSIPVTKHFINPLYMVKVGEEIIYKMTASEKQQARDFLSNQFNFIYEVDDRGEPIIRSLSTNKHFKNDNLMFLAEQLIDRSQRSLWDSVLGEIIDGKDGEFI